MKLKLNTIVFFRNNLNKKGKMTQICGFYSYQMTHFSKFDETLEITHFWISKIYHFWAIIYMNLKLSQRNYFAKRRPVGVSIFIKVNISFSSVKYITSVKMIFKPLQWGKVVATFMSQRQNSAIFWKLKRNYPYLEKNIPRRHVGDVICYQPLLRSLTGLSFNFILYLEPEITGNVDIHPLHIHCIIKSVSWKN